MWVWALVSLFTAGYSWWIYEIGRALSLKTRHTSQYIALSSVKMCLRAEALCDTMIIAAEELKWMAEGLEELE